MSDDDDGGELIFKARVHITGGGPYMYIDRPHVHGVAVIILKKIIIIIFKFLKLTLGR